MKFLCKIIIQIAFNVPPSFVLLKIENKTRLTCRQFYNLLLLLVFGGMVSCRPPREKNLWYQANLRSGVLLPFSGRREKKKKNA